jgi:hypothetical protein
MARAQRAVRELKAGDDLREPVTVFLRGGTFFLDEPWRIGPDDSGAPAPTEGWNKASGPARTVTYAAYPGEHDAAPERPIISGGVRIKGFEATKIGDRDGWRVTLPEVASGDWYFTQLWVNGKRAQRPRLPRDGRFTIEEPLGEVVADGDIHARLFTGQSEFRFSSGDLKEWKNINDIEFVGLHFWIESRINFQSIDEESRTAKLQMKSRMPLTDDFAGGGAPYYVENVFEALYEPGEFYLDRPTGTLYYIPRDGETIDNAVVIAPRLHRVLEITGGTSDAHNIRFSGIDVSHTEWVTGPEASTATPQAACHVGGAVLIDGAHEIEFEGCRVAHVGSYGVEVTGGSRDIAIRGCEITDLGGGGVKVFHPSPRADSTAGAVADVGGRTDRIHTGTCRRILICDNAISDGGYRFHQAVGVLIGRCSAVQLLHNDIYDFDYSGVSVGWTWGYQDGEAYGNIVEHNHIYNIGRGMLSDMGGVYTLGVQPGTRIRYNLIHDVWSRGYGGWGIYNDEGSSHILVEKNIVYRTKSNGYNQHYGRDNIIRNNIFAFGGEAQFSRTRPESHNSFFFEQNILYFDSDGAVLAGNWPFLGATIDRNLYWNISGADLSFAGLTLTKWRSLGADRNSAIADPKFFAPAYGDFRLAEDSPAKAIGFEPFSLEDAGPRVTTPVERGGRG